MAVGLIASSSTSYIIIFIRWEIVGSMSCVDGLTAVIVDGLMMILRMVPRRHDS